MSIKTELDDYFERVTPCLSDNVPLYYAGLFLGIKQIDSLAVVSNNEFVGEIRFLDMLKHMYPLRGTKETPRNLFGETTKDAMSTNPNQITASENMLHVVSKIESSRSGVVFIVEGGRLLGYISLLDITQWLLKIFPKTDLKVNDVCTKNIVMAQSDDTIEEILWLMLDRYIRRVIIEDKSGFNVFDDRDLTNIFFGSKHNSKPYKEIFDIPVGKYARPVATARGDVSITDIAKKMTANIVKCFLVDDYGMICPWDVSIKAYHLLKKTNVQLNH